MRCHIAIIGGGPTGSTVGALLKKYNPELDVTILERERFPREHVGESQLPEIGRILHEIGAWDEVESAGFPIKIGASYTWGETDEPWEFEFLPLNEVKMDQERPAPFEGWRRKTALQVDRARYDEILLRHAAALGCWVHEGDAVRKVDCRDKVVNGLILESGEAIAADYYVDASGNAGVLRRALGIGTDAPTRLQNVAFWSYWDNVPMVDDGFGHGVTRVRVRSLSDGWVWFIPVSESRASVGYVCPKVHYKSAGQSPRELYDAALASLPEVGSLLEGAEESGNLRATTDWSFISERAAGGNWMLAGESLGFADPILAAGLTLSQNCARHCAYTLLELYRGRLSPEWLLQQYEDLQRRYVLQHIRFADYWYSANGCFTDLQEYCSQIADTAGLSLSPEDAFRWLSTGGFDSIPGQPTIGGFDLGGLKQVQHRFCRTSGEVGFLIDGKNVFDLKLEGATREQAPVLKEGRIHVVDRLRRDGRQLDLVGGYKLLTVVLGEYRRIEQIIPALQDASRRSGNGADTSLVFQTMIQCLEVMVNDGWVEARREAGGKALRISSPREGEIIYSSRR